MRVFSLVSKLHVKTQFLREYPFKLFAFPPCEIFSQQPLKILVFFAFFCS